MIGKSVLCKGIGRREIAFAGFRIILFQNCTSGSSSFGRAVAFQASGGRFEPGLPLHFDYCLRRQLKSRCSSVVEHFLGREEVVSSILTNGSSCSSLKSSSVREYPDENRDHLELSGLAAEKGRALV